MSTTLSIENPLKGGVSSDNNLDVRRLDAFAAAQEYRQRRADEPPVQDARARARAAKLEAADVRELGRLNYRFLIQRRTRSIDIGTARACRRWTVASTSPTMRSSRTRRHHAEEVVTRELDFGEFLFRNCLENS